MAIQLSFSYGILIKMCITRPRICNLKKIFVKANLIRSLILIKCLILLWYFQYILCHPDYDLTLTKIIINESSPKINFIECSGRNTFTLKQLCVIERQCSPKKFKNPSAWCVSQYACWSTHQDAPIIFLVYQHGFC